MINSRLKMSKATSAVEKLEENTIRGLTQSQHHAIMREVFKSIKEGIYVESYGYLPEELKPLPNVLQTFFIHIPLSLSIPQYNSINEDVKAKRTLILLLVQPPIYQNVKPTLEANLERDCFFHWKLEMKKNEDYQKYFDFAARYDYTVYSDFQETPMYAKIEAMSKFNGKN